MPSKFEKSTLNIPTINMTPFLIEGSDAVDVKNTVEAIGTACKEWGFFYVVGHQIGDQEIQNFQKVSREFFGKPKEFKNTVARTQNNFRGYSDAEFTKQKLDWKEVYDFGSELISKENRHLDVDGENQWPTSMPQMKTTMLQYFDRMFSISEKLMSAIFESLGADPKSLRKEFEGCKDACFMRVNYYPPCPNPKAQLGVGPHADPSALTILWQDMEVTSLQVERDGVFYDVYPLQDSFVVNIGDMVQVWSNGLYKAPVHRVLVNHEHERYSAPFFYTPAYSCDVTPLDSCISDANPCKYRPINFGHFRKGRFEGDYADVGEEIQIKHFLI